MNITINGEPWLTEPWQPDQPWIQPQPWVYPNTITYPNTPMKTIKRVTRTVEKYSSKGEYLGKEIITEEIEDVEVPDYSWKLDTTIYPITISGETITVSNLGGSCDCINTGVSCNYTNINSPWNQNVSFTSQN